MGNVNALARGLVSFLDTITSGRGPDELQGTVQGTIDLTNFYALNKRERLLLGGVTFSTNGQTNFGGGGAVPANEAWMLYAYSVQSARNAADDFALAPAVQMPVATGNQSWQIGAFYQPTRLGALGGQIFAYADVLPLWIPPGTVLGFLVEGYAAATARTAFGFVDFVRVRL